MPAAAFALHTLKRKFSPSGHRIGRTVGGQEAAFRLEYADFSEGQREFRHAGSDRFHRQVVPVEAGERAMLVGARDDFGAADRGAADIGADDGGSGPVRRDAVKTEGYGIAGVEN